MAEKKNVAAKSAASSTKAEKKVVEKVEPTKVADDSKELKKCQDRIADLEAKLSAANEQLAAEKTAHDDAVVAAGKRVTKRILIGAGLAVANAIVAIIAVCISWWGVSVGFGRATLYSIGGLVFSMIESCGVLAICNLVVSVVAIVLAVVYYFKKVKK